MLNSFNWWWDGGVLLFSLFLESVLSLILLGSFLEDLSIFNWDVNVEGLHIYAGHAFWLSCSLLLVFQQICLNSSYEKKWLFKEERLELFLRLSLVCGQRKPHKTRTPMRPIISGIDSAHNVFFLKKTVYFCALAVSFSFTCAVNIHESVNTDTTIEDICTCFRRW